MSQLYGFNTSGSYNNGSTTTQDNIYSHVSIDQIGNNQMQLHGTSRSENEFGLSHSGSFSFSEKTMSVLSNVEQAILRSQVPIELSDSEEIIVNGQRGVWANKAETINWKGSLPINQYSVNEDPHPQVITKRSQQQLVYQQEVAIRYLRPPTPPAPGEIVIQQEDNKITQPAPPLIIRQQPARPVTPQPLVIREAPPPPPAAVGRKVITISGKKIPPPPRKVIIERLAPLPSKPQSVIIERWLPYKQAKRRVIFQKAQEIDPVLSKPKNVIIQWESPEVQVKKEFKDLGVIRANPHEYVQRYGQTLKTSHDLPSFVLEIKPPSGVVLASDYKYDSKFELEGDIEALKLIDLEREGLSEYRPALNQLEIERHQDVSYEESYSESTSEFIKEMFELIDLDNNGKVSLEEAQKILLKLNSRLGRRYGSDDVANFFIKLDINEDNFVDMEEFKIAFQTSL